MSNFFKPNTKRLLYSVIFSALMVGLLQIPHLNIPAIFLVLTAFPILLAIPLLFLVSPFLQIGKHIEFWFLGFVLKSPVAFVSFFVYYFLVAYVCLYKVGREDNKNTDGADHCM
jgi:hypothetical protein